MKVGDLVKYTIGIWGKETGIITRTPEQTGNGDYEVYFGNERQWCRECYLELIQKKT